MPPPKQKTWFLTFQLEIHRFHWSQASHHVSRMMPPVRVKTNFETFWDDFKLPDNSNKNTEKPWFQWPHHATPKKKTVFFNSPIGNTSIPLLCLYIFSSGTPRAARKQMFLCTLCNRGTKTIVIPHCFDRRTNSGKKTNGFCIICVAQAPKPW